VCRIPFSSLQSDSQAAIQTQQTPSTTSKSIAISSSMKSLIALLFCMFVTQVFAAPTLTVRDDDDKSTKGSKGDKPSKVSSSGVKTMSSSTCQDCRNGVTCVKKLDIPAWYSKSFVVSNDAAAYNVWNYQVATTDSNDRLSVYLQDSKGATYVASDKNADYASCVTVENFVTQENTNRLVIGCNNWFTSCQANFNYRVSASNSADGANSAGTVITPEGQTTSPTSSVSPLVIGLSVGFALLAALLLGLLTWFCIRKKQKQQKHMEDELQFPMQTAQALDTVPMATKPRGYLDQDEEAIAQAVAASLADVKVPPSKSSGTAGNNGASSRSQPTASADYSLPAYYAPADPLPPPKK
jgi:hypothetical protein